jgi:hypothetical protein
MGCGQFLDEKTAGGDRFRPVKIYKSLCASQRVVTHLSFDLDGTLEREEFDKRM